MMNLLTGMNGQLPVKGKQSAERTHIKTEKQPGEEEANARADIRHAAKEMESLFAYQMLKVMRETTESMADEKKGNGYNTYMSMFDTEISKVLAERGMGLQDAIVRWLEHSESVNGADNVNNEKVNITINND